MLQSQHVLLLWLYAGFTNGCVYIIYVNLSPLCVRSLDFSISGAGYVLLMCTIAVLISHWTSHSALNDPIRAQRRRLYQMAVSVLSSLCTLGLGFFLPGRYDGNDSQSKLGQSFFVLLLAFIAFAVTGTNLALQSHLTETSSPDPKSARPTALFLGPIFAGILPLGGLGEASAPGYRGVGGWRHLYHWDFLWPLLHGVCPEEIQDQAGTAVSMPMHYIT